jgi:hypothetical protein
MKKIFFVIPLVILTLMVSVPVFAAPSWKGQEGYARPILIIVDGKGYYLAGEPVDGGSDVPGHSWRMTGPNTMVGLHHNTGPGGLSYGWSSDADDGALLYLVEGIIDTWSKGKAEKYAKIGFVHYHELVSVDDGSLHPRKVVWLRHTSVYPDTFTLDGGPANWGGGGADPPYIHDVEPGLVDYLFPNNYMTPYVP